MKKITLMAWAGCLLFALGFPSSAPAYETPTHSAMSGQAAAASNLDGRMADFCGDIGLTSIQSFLPDGGFSFFGIPLFEKSQPVVGWIQEGSVAEDSWFGLRFLNHFYNPLAPAGQEGYSYGGLTGLPSLTWGLEPQDISGQDYSYRDARTYFYQGLTAPTEIARRQNLAKTFRTIGDVIHLIQDLGQPQHTRNDSHGLGSLYEEFTNQDDVRPNLPFGGYAPVQFPTPDQFWRTPDGKGLANYTNRGFVTAGTNFTGTSASIQPNPNFPSPNGAGASVITMQITDPSLLPELPNPNLTGEIQFIQTPVVDSYTGAVETNPRTSTFSIFDEDLLSAGAAQTFTLNRFNFLAAHDLLIKRAVGYSAGMINYFFRGKIEITPPQEGAYGVLDHSQNPTGFQKIKLNLKNSTPNEDMSNGTLVAVAKYHLNGCYQSDLSGEFSEDSSGNLITPCADYRSDDQGIAISQAIPGFGLASGSNTDLTFDFSANPIPINATDLYLQVVFQGTLGQETGAVVGGTKDIAEPTYLTIFNSTDYFDLNGTFYTPSNILSDPNLLAQIDLNHDGIPDENVVPVTLQLNIGFIPLNSNTTVPVPAIMPVTSQPIQPGHFIRLVVLVDDGNAYAAAIQSSSNPALFSGTDNRLYTPETNQLDFSSGSYFVAALEKLRTINVWDSLTYYRTPFITNGGPEAKLESLPAAASPTPDQVNVNF